MGYIGARVKNTVCLLACKLTILANAERILSILLASVFRSSSSDSEGATAAAVIPIEWLPWLSLLHYESAPGFFGELLHFGSAALHPRDEP